MADQIVYSKMPRQRKKNFQLETKIFMNASGDYFVKKAPMNVLAEPHAKSLIPKSEKMIKQFGEEFVINIAYKLETNDMYFPYVNGRSIETVTNFYIKQGKKQEIYSLLDTLIEKILRGQQVDFVVTDSFIDIFGDIVFTKKMKSLKISNIDLTFSNILLDDAENWHLIDYEWTFDFPIPVDYILFRSFYFNNKLMNDKEIRDYYFKRMGLTDEIVKVFLLMEQAFQKYVYGDGRKLEEQYKVIGKSVRKLVGNELKMENKSSIVCLQTTDGKIKRIKSILDDQSHGVIRIFPSILDEMKMLVYFPCNVGCIIKIKKVVGETIDKSIDLAFESNCALRIVDDYYFIEKPKITFLIDKLQSVLIEYEVLVYEDKELTFKVDLLKREYEARQKNMQLQYLLSDYQKEYENYKSAYEQEAETREIYESAYEEMKMAYEQEAKARKEYESAYGEMKMAYEQEAKARKEYESAYEEVKMAYEQEAKMREEYASAYKNVVEKKNL